MRGSAGGLDKLSAGVSGLVKKPLDCTVRHGRKKVYAHKFAFKILFIYISHFPEVFV